MACKECMVNACGCSVSDQIKIITLQKTIVTLKNGLAKELARRYADENLTKREVRALVEHMLQTY